MKSLSSSESGSQFAALKKDFLFHEKRMQLLLSSSIVEGLDAAIAEKLTTRNECADDCKKTLEKLSHASQMPTLSGRWNESVVASVLQLSIPLRDVIGSQLFEATPTNECEDLKDIVLRLAEQSQDHAHTETGGGGALVALTGTNSGASIGPDSELVKGLLKSIEPTALTLRDVKRMRDAVQSKLRVIAELSHLSEALQKSGFQLAQARADVCRLQEEEALANDEGEVAVSEQLVGQRIAALEKIIDIIFFRLHTVDATVDTNVTKRHSNLQALQHSAVALEGVKREKQDAVAHCGEDIHRIDRSLQLQQVKERNDSKGAEMLAESAKRLRDIDGKRVELQDRLQQLGQEFIETERALAKLGVERAVAIDRHLDLVEQSRHLAADFAEMARFASAHRKNLEVTKQRCSEGLGSVELLERLLLQETDFMQYNFRASAQRLQTVRENVATELRAALREYEISIGEMLRRKQEIVLGLDEQIHVAECEAELRKDVFDPTAKKFVDKQKELELRRKAVVDEMCALSEKLGQQISTIRSRLGEEFISGNSGGATASAAPGSSGAGGGRFGAAAVSLRDETQRGGDARRLVAELKDKVLAEMSLLEQEQRQAASADSTASAAAAATGASTTTQRNASKYLRDIVDGVARISEDEELLQRNLRKHERLLDSRQALLEERNQHLAATEEKKELLALQQHIESSYIGPGPHNHVTQRQELLSARSRANRYQQQQQQQQRHRDAVLSPSLQNRTAAVPRTRVTLDGIDGDDENVNVNDTSNASLFSGYGARGAAASAGGASGTSMSRAQAVRDEIRRARAHASALFSPQQQQQQQHGHYDGDISATSPIPAQFSAASTYRVGDQQQQQQQRRGLAQVLAQSSASLLDDEDEDAARHAGARRGTAAGTTATVRAQRAHPRVIGRPQID